MNNKLFITVLLCISSILYAQEETIDSIYVESSILEVEMDSSYVKPKRHIVKMNLPSLIVGTFSFQYEFFPTSFLSIALGYKFTPERGMVFKDKVIDLVEDSSNADDLDDPGARFFSHFRFKGNAITPEVRFYLGEGYGKGFYLGPFVRFDNYKFTSLYPFEGAMSFYDIDFEGKFKSFGYGLNIGAQYRIGRIAIDAFLGPYFSNVKINFNSVSNYTMTDEDAQWLVDELSDFKLPNGKTEITANKNSVRVKMTADNFINLRFGLGIGYRF